jgi:hypothetical protein
MGGDKLTPMAISAVWLNDNFFIHVKLKAIV